MKTILLTVLSLLIFWSSWAFAKSENFEVKKDSTLRARFIKSLLEDPNMDSVWVLIKVDSLKKLPNNYEVVHPGTLYKNILENFHTLSKRDFINGIFDALLNSIPFERYSGMKTLISGVKIDTKKYRNLLKKDLNFILKTYFNKNRTLKPQYNNILHELIGVCYMKNVKLFTPIGQSPYYEMFK